MAGDEEARARASLAEMQGRIAQGPEAALGLGETVSPEHVRAAFLELTKQYHPARFGRMSADLQRLSNEVFLGIKSAHDTLQRAVGGVVRGIRQTNQSGAMPISSDASGRIPIPARATSSSMGAARPSASQPPANRPGGPDTRRASTPPANTAGTRAAPRTATPPLGVSVSRTPTPGLRPGTPPPGQARPVTPSPGPARTGSRPTTPQPDPSRTPPRPTTPPLSQRPGTPPAAAGKPPTSPPTPSGAPPRAAPVADERVALREALSLLNDRDWPAARQALHNLATRVPQSKPYRALLCYARGREAQAAGKQEDALLEVQRALQLDPELEQAKQALAELQRRR